MILSSSTDVLVCNAVNKSRESCWEGQMEGGKRGCVLQKVAKDVDYFVGKGFILIIAQKQSNLMLLVVLAVAALLLRQNPMQKSNSKEGIALVELWAVNKDSQNVVLFVARPLHQTAGY
jgi:hypothetical protein